MKTASYCPRLAAIIRCFNLLSEGRTSNAGGSAENMRRTRDSDLLEIFLKYNNWIKPVSLPLPINTNSIKVIIGNFNIAQ